MLSSEALERLRALLDQAGVNRHAPSAADVPLTWEVVRQFSKEPVEDADPVDRDGDALLAEYGVDRNDDGGAFEVDITRQLSFSDADGNYDHMTQLHCTFRFALSEELKELEAANLWSFGMTVDEFLTEALAMPGFQYAGEPLSLATRYGRV